MFNYKNIYIDDWYSIIGPKEKSDGNLKKYNLALSDYYFNEKTIEKAEVRMQKFALNYFKSSKIDVVCASDLMDQLIVSNLMAEEEDIPFLGVYNACASFASGVISIANMIQSKGVKRGVYITSSHNLSAEKQFRFPIEYGAVKPKRSTFTATGAVGVSLNNTSGKIKIISATLGKVKDSYVKDAFNMGGVMAISAIATFKEHLKNRCKSEEDYDLILTGDLGACGSKIFKRVLKSEGYNLKKYMDAGENFYKKIDCSGASGPTVLPLFLFNNIVHNKKYKKILLLATGSLHSPLLVNQKMSIPSVTHALEIEVVR